LVACLALSPSAYATSARWYDGGGDGTTQGGGGLWSNQDNWAISGVILGWADNYTLPFFIPTPDGTPDDFDGDGTPDSPITGDATGYTPVAGDHIRFDLTEGYTTTNEVVHVDVDPLGDGSSFVIFECKKPGVMTIDLHGRTLNFSSSVGIYRNGYADGTPTGDVVFTFVSSEGTGTLNSASQSLYANNRTVADDFLGVITLGENMDVNVAKIDTGQGGHPTLDGSFSGQAIIRLTDNADLSSTGDCVVATRGNVTEFTGLLDLQDSSILTVGGNLLLGDDGAGDGVPNWGEIKLVGSNVTTSVAGNGVFENGQLTFELASPPSVLNITGDLTIGATVEIDIDITGAPPSLGTEYLLVDVGGTMTGTFTLAAEDVGQWTLTHTTGGSGQVTATYVPEPMTMLLVGGGLLALIRRR
jgi:hypothetical protein